MKAARMAAVAAVGSLIVSLVVRADGPSKESKPKNEPPEYLSEFHALKQECNKRLDAVYSKAEKAFDEEKSQPRLDAIRKSVGEEADAIRRPAVQKAFELVKPHAAEAAAAEPLVWLAQSGGDSEIGAVAAAMLIAHHPTREPVLQLSYASKRSGKNWVEPMLRAQLASADLTTDWRAKQKLALAFCLQTQSGRQEGARAKLDEEAVKLFSELADESPNAELIPGVTVGDVARTSLFEIKNLAVGKVAPDIEGEDLDGAALKLSDYRGQVVMLSFWASWCGPCMDLLPHERELVERYRGHPFALIGVNCDGNKEELKSVVGESEIRWRSLWAGEKGPAGPIPRAWNVTSWPTVYLIDHAGVIRAKRHAGAIELDSLLETLVADAEKHLEKN